jgi:hypothetical protein
MIAMTTRAQHQQEWREGSEKRSPNSMHGFLFMRRSRVHFIGQDGPIVRDFPFYCLDNADSFQVFLSLPRMRIVDFHHINFDSVLKSMGSNSQFGFELGNSGVISGMWGIEHGKLGLWLIPGVEDRDDGGS